MNKSIFYYNGSKAHKILTTATPVSPDYLADMAWDQGMRLTQPVVPAPAIRTEREILADKAKVTTAQRSHKQLRKAYPEVYAENRNALIKALVNAAKPNYGSLKLSFTL